MPLLTFSGEPMAEYSSKDLTAMPQFDLELLLNSSNETRIGGDLMDSLGNAWERWLASAKARQIETGDGGYLLAWLEERVEEEVDDKWEEAPSDAFMFNALAQVMCMGIVHALLPEVEDAGCAPAPRPTELLAAALEAEGVPYRMPGEPGLVRRYAVVTHYPFRGGCEICMLRKQCPKAGGDGGVSVTLPGFER
jgi:hypothetical protein